MSPGFVAYLKSMIQGWIDEAKASKREKDASTPKSRAGIGRGGGGRRAADGGAGGSFWSPLGGKGNGASMMRQVSGASS